jgi:hypothetical protein
LWTPFGFGGEKKNVAPPLWLGLRFWQQNPRVKAKQVFVFIFLPLIFLSVYFISATEPDFKSNCFGSYALDDAHK